MYDFIIYANFIAENINVKSYTRYIILNRDVSRSNIISLLIVSTTFALSTSGRRCIGESFPRSGRSINLSHKMANEIFKLTIIRHILIIY